MVEPDWQMVHGAAAVGCVAQRVERRDVAGGQDLVREAFVVRGVDDELEARLTHARGEAQQEPDQHRQGQDDPGRQPAERPLRRHDSIPGLRVRVGAHGRLQQFA